MHGRQAPYQLNSTPVLKLLPNSIWVLTPPIPYYKTDQEFSNAVPWLYFCWGYLRPWVHPSHSRKRILTQKHLRHKWAKEAAHCPLRGGEAKGSFLCGLSLLYRTTWNLTIRMTSSFRGLRGFNSFFCRLKFIWNSRTLSNSPSFQHQGVCYFLFLSLGTKFQWPGRLPETPVLCVLTSRIKSIDLGGWL